jgi:response regulator RpfG family c-di-GMP phosphodiesterase
VRDTARAPLLLIVDDEQQILSALRRSLRREGFEIIAVNSAREALRTLEEHPVDIILSDHKMPHMTGLQFLARAAERWPDTSRLLLTGWTASIPQQKIRALGIRAVIPKPWDDATLKEILRKAFKDLT